MNLFDADTKALYASEIDDSRRTSLSALFGLVRPGSTVLDVGIGGGALGRRLAAERGCRVDGVTLSDVEAAASAAHYRRIEVADLNRVGLAELFAGEHYDAIICADVLEHLARPTQVLDACRLLLAEAGELLLSIPNVGYLGLIGELLAGEFRYRIEGLLDATHVRFFTRRSLLRMLRESGWDGQMLEPITVDLPESEFKVEFDRLPPSVQRHLLTMPDALTYQFIVRARPGSVGTAAFETADERAVVGAPAIAPAAPRFSSLLYLNDGSGYAEDRKVVAEGRLGDARQMIRFELPPQQTLAALRVDPADRPGFLHLFGMRLLNADGRTVWQWDGRCETLARGACQQMIFRTPWFEHQGTVALLTGDDPWFELSLDRATLACCCDGAALEIELSWPMSADYALLAGELNALQSRLAEADNDAQDLARMRQRVHDLEQSLAVETDSVQQLRHDADALTAARDALHVQAKELAVSLQQAERDAAGLRRRVEQQRAQRNAAARERDDLRQRLMQMRESRGYRFAALFSPALRFDLRVPASRGASRVRALPPSAETVDIVVPVYKGLAETKACLESVLASASKRPFRVVIVDDASPEPQLTGYLRQLRDRDTRVALIENPANAGFVTSVNRGMQHDGSRDVVLLNSDTEVAGDWLDRLQRAAYSSADVGTATPFSNSATICSYPRFCEDNRLPDGMSTAELDAIFAAENPGRALEIPTAVGFCMYIRRDCLNAVGSFDVANFGRGYGEENDFCMRARKAGWRHMLALDTFVAHVGGASFGAEKARRVEEAQATLRRLHPEYEVLVQRHLAEDPARPARLAVDLARVRASALRSVLFVSHFGGGGTERHVRELAAALEGRTNAFLLRPSNNGETLLEWLQPGEGFCLAFRLDAELPALVEVLRALDVSHVHYHHLLGQSPCVWGLPEMLGVAHDFTVHDYYSICPQISLTDRSNRYCGEEGPAQCAECLRRTPPPGRVSIETWRDGYRRLIESARYVFAPSADAGDRMRRYFPAANVVHAPHFDMLYAPPVIRPALLREEHPLRIVVIGALSTIKGADVLEGVAMEAARRGERLEFHLLGFAYRTLQTQPKARLTVHGPYQEADLPDLLEWLKPDLAWFPALWPETYSYTLSACLNARLPIVAPDLGAFPERLHVRPWTWIRPWEQTARQWVDFFALVRSQNFCAGVDPEPGGGRIATTSQFSYERDYLPKNSTAQQPMQLAEAFLHHYRPGRVEAGPRQRAKRAVHQLAARVKHAPVVGDLTRLVPMHWQERAKAWLKD